VDVQPKGWVQALDKLWIAVVMLWTNGVQEGKTTGPKKKPPEGGLPLARREMVGYAVSPYTVTLMSTTTSVCNATPTVESPTVLIGPFGMRTCALTTL